MEDVAANGGTPRVQRGPKFIRQLHNSPGIQRGIKFGLDVISGSIPNRLRPSPKAGP
ncbi:hypothetical protein I553_7684 [Mycobacterium xenopi 4042]|uniref:Uncharacterized protein n=1 Tax=Mycobacterium xenopi 4042 TaxID=1299334 RepID=X8ANX3_MYCXE|nr:hypothetical protein I553_7684 [Mycobacterium xenopi 4042]